MKVVETFNTQLKTMSEMVGCCIQFVRVLLPLACLKESSGSFIKLGVGGGWSKEHILVSSCKNSISPLM